MTASAPSGAMKHTAKRPSNAKEQILGQMPVEPPLHSDITSNGLGKTATRSKAGCMTCRIRRKKCDLQRVGDSCQTCVRLRIGCLGWGAKRPEALRNPEVVKEIQRRIKVHLASNNMIKGSARSSAAATPAPQPSSTPSNDIPGGAAGGAGASYGGQSFLSFADLIGTNASSHNEAQSSASSRKGKNRQAKHAPVDTAVEGSSDDGFGEDELPEGDPGPDEGASSFSRHPPGYPQPNYDPPQYRPRYPYEMGSPPQQPPYHAHAPHPYAQSDLRTRSYEYDNERDMRVDDSLRKAERERESYRPQVPNGNLPRPPYEPNVGYPAFPGHHFIYGPGVGAASAGRALAGYTQFGHAGYRGPSPGTSLNSSFASGPPPPKTDPFYSGPRLMMDARQGTAALPGPPLSMSIGRSGGTSPTSDQYLQPMEHNPNGTTYNESGYRSPNPPLSRSPMGAGMTSSRDSISHLSGETAEEAADVDGEPMTNPHQLSAGASASTQVDSTTAYAPNPSSYTSNPHQTTFGPIYTLTFQDAELDGSSTGALVSATNNPAVINNLPLGTDIFSSMMAMMGIGSLADVPDAIKANANTTDVTQLAALQQVQVAIAPPPPIDSQPMYIASFGSQHLQFTARQMELLHLYKNDLCNLQYHIAHSTDSSIADELFDLAMNSEAALFGTLTLTSLYKIRLRGGAPSDPQSEEMVEVNGFMERVSTALAQKKQHSMLDSGDAMAALHMVSAVLFEGGTSAEWDGFLDIAKAYVAQHPIVKMRSWNSSPTLDATSGGRFSGAMTTTVDKKTQFIIKTVAWFDVIGSVTMRRKPFFLDTYRELFGREGGAAMERIMGCNEKVLLAIAETAALAAWRREEENKGTLNIMNLAQKGVKIDGILSFTGPQYNGSGFDDYLGNMSEAQMEQERQARTVRLVSNVFRAAGRLYLHTVVSGCNPDVQDIKTAVQATVDAFKVLEASDFDRSLVFPITLAGCMTDNKEHRSYLEGRLLMLGFKGQAVGNSSSCLKLMHQVWKKRDQQLMGSRIVDWIDTMHDLGWSLLLV